MGPPSTGSQRKDYTPSDDPDFVPAGAQPKTEECFGRYGWRERHYTLNDLTDFPRRVFWATQNVIPEDWDMNEMSATRKRLNKKLRKSDRLSLKEWGNMALYLTRAAEGLWSPSEWWTNWRLSPKSVTTRTTSPGKYNPLQGQIPEKTSLNRQTLLTLKARTTARTTASTTVKEATQ